METRRTTAHLVVALEDKTGSKRFKPSNYSSDRFEFSSSKIHEAGYHRPRPVDNNPVGGSPVNMAGVCLRPLAIMKLLDGPAASRPIGNLGPNLCRSAPASK
jgi:hypothetical protein